MVLNFTLSDLKGLAVGPVAAQSSKGAWEKYSLLKCFHKDMFLFHNHFLIWMKNLIVS